jgi:hypothetical protein
MYAHATDEDLRAIFLYLKTTKPVKNVVPHPFLPTGLEANDTCLKNKHNKNFKTMKNNFSNRSNRGTGRKRSPPLVEQ